MSLLTKLGKLLRVPADEVEAVLRHDERRARETVNRRRFMGAAAALASAPFVPNVWIDLGPKPMTKEQLIQMITQMARDNALAMLAQANAVYHQGLVDRIVIEGTIEV